MKEFLTNSAYFGLILSLAAYFLGMILNKKFKSAFFNPLLLASIFVIALLIAFHIPYDTYNASAQYISYLLTPSTICLAVPLYKQLALLKKNLAAILTGVLSGVVISLVCVVLLALVFELSREDTITLLPKSVTTAIGIGISEENGGISTLTAAIIIITGITGNVSGRWVCKLFRIREPISKGIALGTTSHAIGTAKALEMGEIEGAMGSLAIAVAGLLTAFIIPLLTVFLPI
jgi:predicted murein hydrolase (TIGR00659 family)